MIQWKFEELRGQIEPIPSATLVAEDSGVSRPTIQRLQGRDRERGYPVQADLDVLEKLCAYFTWELGRKVGVGDLLEWVEEE